LDRPGKPVIINISGVQSAKEEPYILNIPESMEKKLKKGCETMHEIECRYCRSKEKPFIQHTELICSVCGNTIKRFYGKALKAEKKKLRKG
jgi:hypothetical protein